MAAHAGGGRGAIAAADDQLDDCIKAFDRGLQDVVRGNTESPRYRRYFAGAPWTYIRLGLESEISRVGGRPASLAGEPEQSLKDWGLSLTKLIAQGQAALDQRRKAVAARKDHRVPSLAPEGGRGRGAGDASREAGPGDGRGVESDPLAPARRTATCSPDVLSVAESEG
jgi:hypothetical protein